MINRLRSMLFVMPVALGAAACSFDDVPAEPLWTEGAGERTVVDVELESLWRIGGESDTLLLRPGVLTARSDGVMYYDFADAKIVALDAFGEPEWHFGQEGDGPGEFRLVRSLQSLPDGGVLAYDAEAARLTILDREGGSIQEVRLPGNVDRGDAVVRDDSGAYRLITYSPAAPLVTLEPDGTVRRAAMPWEAFERLHVIDRQGVVVSQGDDWAYLFSFGNGFFSFHGSEPLPYLGQFVEHVDFPRLVTTRSASSETTTFAGLPVCAACAAALSDGVLYVLFGGGTADNGRVVDRYRFQDGAYLDSFRLPERYKAIALKGDRLYALIEDPYPEIVAYRLNPGTPAASSVDPGHQE